MECSYCGNEVATVYEPPLLRVPLFELPQELEIGRVVWWHAPGQGYPGKDPFTVVAIEDYDAVLLPPETSSDERLCYLCFAGRMWPALHRYCCNKPDGLRFNGWLDPIWEVEASPASGGGIEG